MSQVEIINHYGQITIYNEAEALVSDSQQQ